MTKLTSPLEFTDAYGFIHKLKSNQSVEKFIDQEDKAWEWLSKSAHRYADMSAIHRGVISNLRNAFDQFKAGHINEHDFKSRFSGPYTNHRPTFLISGTTRSDSIKKIRSERGDEVAELALALSTSALGVDVNNALHLEMSILSAAPVFISGTAQAEQHLAAISEYRSKLRSIDESLEQALDDSNTRQTNAIDTATKNAWKLAIRYARYHRKKLQQTGAAAAAQIEAMNETDKTFREYMNMAASVEYWSSSSVEFASSRKSLETTLIIYSLISILITIAIYVAAGYLIINFPGKPALYFLTAAGVASIMAFVFWAGRVLVRLYLGARNLERDASERVTMMKSYLALINEGGATSSEDRLVVLNALFRPATDGIIPDDSGGDVALPALLSRLLDTRRIGT